MVGTTPRRLIAIGIVAIALVGCSERIQPSPSVAPTPSASVISASPDAESSLSDGALPSGAALMTDGSSPAWIAFWDARNGLIGGRGPEARPAIARTSDGGRTLTWVDVGSDVPSELNVFASSDAVYLSGCTDEPAVDCAPNLVRTTDGGLAWTTVGSGAQLAGLRRISFPGRIGWGVAKLPPGDLEPDPNAVALRRSPDGGRTWTTVRDPCPVTWPTLVDVRFVDATHGWLVCAGQGSGTMAPTAIYVTSDGGKTFAVQSTSDFGGNLNLGRAPSGPVTSIEAADLTTAFVMQGRSGTARTDDGGVTWTAGPPGDPEIVFVDTMSATPDGTVLAMAQDGEAQLLILEASADGGRTWEQRAAWPRS